ncbi:tryptophan biosynthesis protein TrpCF, partial [Pluralibacter gergoviae]
RAAADPVQRFYRRSVPDLPGALLSGGCLPADALGAQRR